jgi:hypothetical protein
MTMINDVLKQLEYLKLKSAYSYLNSQYIENRIEESELMGIYKILNEEVKAKVIRLI